MEFEVFIGGKNLLKTFPPKVIVFEANSDTLGNLTDPKVKIHLESLGYRIDFIRRSTPALVRRINLIAIYGPPEKKRQPT